MTESSTLLPEWSPQEAILLSWPDETTDWVDWLPEVRQTYLELIAKINRYSCGVVLLASTEQIPEIKSQLPDDGKVLIVPADYNDTWIRDYGFLTIKRNNTMHPISFIFNGWGMKFNAEKDNQINARVLAPLCQNEMETVDLVLEGGALEIDEKGVLLSTELCLTNPERNGRLSLPEYKKLFQQHLGAAKTIILKNGHLEGDDTDGHIDTLVRFTPQGHLVIQSAFNRPNDPHFAGLNALVSECQAHFPEKRILQLPLPKIVNEEGDRLPASYANYLISNNQLFAPVYLQSEDDQAIEVLTCAYPDFQIVPINCRALVEQFGSLHCISMQVPTNTLKPEIIEQLQSGVSVYE